MAVVVHGRIRIIRRACWMAAILFLAACQGGGQPALTLDQAKKATAEFSGSYTPPPRSINDILAPIRQQDLGARGCKGSAPLSDEKVREMMSSLASLGKRAVTNFALSQAEIQFHRGNYPRSIEYMNMAIDEAPDSRFWTTVSYAQLAAYHAFAGNVDEASDALSIAGSDLMRIQRYSGSYSQRSLGIIFFNLNLARGAVANLKGDLIISEAYYRKAIKKLGSTRVGVGQAFASVGLARNLMHQGRLVEAENVIRDLLRHKLDKDLESAPMALALAQLAAILYEQGRYGEAAALARETVGVYRVLCTAPESLQLASVQEVLARSLVAEGHWAEAIEQYEIIRANMAEDRDSYDRLFAGNVFRALAFLKTGRGAEARGELALALEKSRRRYGEENYGTAEVRGFLAMARLAEGDRENALKEFAAAGKVLLAGNHDSDGDGSTYLARDRRLALILGAYMGLLADIRGTALETSAGLDSAAEAFRLGNIARSRSVQRALSASGARAAIKDPALAELARREQDTQKQITALFGALAKSLMRPTADQDRAYIEGVKDTIEKLRAARAALKDEIGRRFPDYAQLIDPRPATIGQARSSLHPGEALIVTYVGVDRTFVWAIPSKGQVSFAAIDLGHEELTDTVSLLRGALEPNARTLGDIPEFDLSAAHGLYAKLLEPVKAGWGKANSLLIVAHGPLGYLPMSILPTAAATLGPEAEPLFANYRDVPWLARTHAVTQLPSVASLKTLRGLPPGDEARLAFAGFGDPWFSAEQAAAAANPEAKPRQVAALESRGIKTRGLRLRAAPKTTEMDSAELARLPRLPDTAAEVTSIAVALKANLTDSVFLGREANEGQIKSMDLSGYKVLAFATHGLVPGDLNGLVQPALALSSPKVAGGSDDGLLTMGEILGLKLNADWVVLSACNTGSGQGAGAEAVSGLGQAFFYAGTRALLVSNWPVETTSARTLTTDLFKRQADDPGLTRAQALRQAMVALIDDEAFVDDTTGQAVFAYAHPLFWAPFSLVGDGGGGRQAQGS